MIKKLNFSNKKKNEHYGKNNKENQTYLQIDCQSIQKQDIEARVKNCLQQLSETDFNMTIREEPPIKKVSLNGGVSPWVGKNKKIKAEMKIIPPLITWQKKVSQKILKKKSLNYLKLGSQDDQNKKKSFMMPKIIFDEKIRKKCKSTIAKYPSQIFKQTEVSEFSPTFSKNPIKLSKYENTQYLRSKKQILSQNASNKNHSVLQNTHQLDDKNDQTDQKYVDLSKIQDGQTEFIACIYKNCTKPSKISNTVLLTEVDSHINSNNSNHLDNHSHIQTGKSYDCKNYCQSLKIKHQILSAIDQQVIVQTKNPTYKNTYCTHNRMIKVKKGISIRKKSQEVIDNSHSFEQRNPMTKFLYKKYIKVIENQQSKKKSISNSQFS